jgi:dephospho-CoA kinase
MHEGHRLRIGLTGGIGSGKSTVARLLCGLGAALIDTDAIARELTLSGGAAVEPIRRVFGNDLIDSEGALDRGSMRTLAFSDPAARKRLESILHPLIGVEAERRAAAAEARTLVFDVPLLAESAHWRGKVDKVLVIDCLEQTQVDRVVSRSGWSTNAVRSVIAQQASRAARRACADAVIFNDGVSIDDLTQTLLALGRHWGIAAVMTGPVEQ